MIAEGAVGTVQQVRAAYRQDWLVDPGMPLAWRLQKEHAGSGALGDIGAHIIDMTRFVTGLDIDSVTGTLETIVMEALEESGLSPQSLELELTETLLLEDEYDIKGQISRLAAHGVSFSVDDFGKGYSNLGNLGKFDVATLKIDQSFTFAMFDCAQDLALVEAIVRMAKALGLKIVAEGVETQRAASMLSLFGVDSGQGYYWSKPLPLDDFIGYLDGCEGGKAKSA